MTERGTVRDWVAGFAPSRGDLCFAGALGAIAFLYAFTLSGWIAPRLAASGTLDLWFEADVPRVFANMTDRWSDHARANAHPLFSLLTLGPVWTLSHIGVPELLTVRLELAVAAALTVTALFAALRLAGADTRAAGLFGLLGLGAAGTLFWVAVPETHALGSVTVALTMLVAAAKCHGRTVPEGVDLIACSGSLTMTSTNWMFGILSTLPRRSIARFAMLVLASLGLVTGLWAVQHRFVPSADFFLGKSLEEGMILTPESFGPRGVARSFLFHSVVMPAIQLVDRPSTGAWPVMLVQPAGAGSSGTLGIVGVALWTALLALGARAAIRSWARWPLVLFLAGGLIGQLTLYIYFGNETFLYAPSFLPPLIVLAGLGAIGANGRLSLLIVVLLIPVATANNLRQLDRSLSFFEDYAELRHASAETAAERPNDPWPRRTDPLNVEHVPLPPLDLGKHELGGGFSPAKGSFGVSFWVLDANGGLVAASSRIPPTDIVQRTGTSDAGTVSRVETTTPYYHVVWSANGLRDWTLEVADVPDGLALAVVVRGTAPGGGGPIRSIEADDDGLLVRSRWRLDPATDRPTIGLGVEGPPGWMSNASERRVEDPGGWAWARILLADGSRETFRVYDPLAGGLRDATIGVLRE